MENPLEYFEDLLSCDQTLSKKMLYLEDQLSNWTQNVTDIDYEEGIIEEELSFYEDGTWESLKAYSRFSNFFLQEVELHCKTLRNYIINKNIEISLSGGSPRRFLDYLSKKIESYINAAVLHYSHYPFLHLNLIHLKRFIEDQPIPDTSLSSANISDETPSQSLTIDDSDTSTINSFRWDLMDPADSLVQLGKLYDLLVQFPAIIEGTKEEFIDGFTGKEVTTGIRWKLTSSKNRLVSKASLIYFLQQLVEKSDLTEETVDFNKKVEYVFRGPEGEKLRYIKQSKSAMTQFPDHHERIDDLIDLFLSI